mgnify:CR=1 FL=1
MAPVKKDAFDKAMWAITIVAMLLVFGSPFAAMWGLIPWGLAVRLVVTGVFGWLLGAAVVGMTLGRRRR